MITGAAQMDGAIIVSVHTIHQYLFMNDLVGRIRI
jgi:hypothetical protein